MLPPFHKELQWQPKKNFEIRRKSVSNTESAEWPYKSLGSLAVQRYGAFGAAAGFGTVTALGACAAVGAVGGCAAVVAAAVVIDSV
jgi:hypothetical protein